jgi:hypothetical protein
MAVTAERVGDRAFEPAPSAARMFVILVAVAALLVRVQVVGHVGEDTVLRTNDLIATRSQ